MLLEESSGEFSNGFSSQEQVSSMGLAFITGASLAELSEDLTGEDHGSRKPKRNSNLSSNGTSRASANQWLTQLSKSGLRRAVKENIKLEDLKKHDMLGEGQYGQVYLVSADVSPEYGMQLFALKTQKKNDSRRGDTSDIIKREIDLLSLLDHPYIVNLVHHYEKPEEMHILMGAVYGGELFDVIHTENSDGTWSSGLPESDAKFYAMVITDTLDYIHRKQFVYRDLKPGELSVAKFFDLMAARLSQYMAIFDIIFCRKCFD